MCWSSTKCTLSNRSVIVVFAEGFLFYTSVKVAVKAVNNVRFQITVLVRFSSVWFWLVTVLVTVWLGSLLLCPFQKKLRIRWKKSFGFYQTHNPRFSCIMFCYKYLQLTWLNLKVSESSTLRKWTKRKSLVIRSWYFP